MKKPFDLEELLLKVCKFTQRINTIYLDENIYFDTKERKLFLNNLEIELTKIEKSLLFLLLANKGKNISHSQIEDFVYDRVAKTSNSIRSLVKRLKKKIPKDLIQNSIGDGYIIK